MTVTTRPDGSKQTSTAVERVKLEKKDKKEKKERKSPVRSHSPRSHSPRQHHNPSPPKQQQHHSSSSVTRSVPRCGSCNKKSKNGANFCEVGVVSGASGVVLKVMGAALRGTRGTVERAQQAQLQQVLCQAQARRQVLRGEKTMRASVADLFRA